MRRWCSGRRRGDNNGHSRKRPTFEPGASTDEHSISNRWLACMCPLVLASDVEGHLAASGETIPRVFACREAQPETYNRNVPVVVWGRVYLFSHEFRPMIGIIVAPSGKDGESLSEGRRRWRKKWSDRAHDYYIHAMITWLNRWVVECELHNLRSPSSVIPPGSRVCSYMFTIAVSKYNRTRVAGNKYSNVSCMRQFMRNTIVLTILWCRVQCVQHSYSW